MRPQSTDTPAKARRKRQLHRFLQQLRRLHLYTGLLLAPWAIFFGLSALLFNHPDVGERAEVRRLRPDELAAIADFEAIDPSAAATAVASTMPGPGGPYSVDPSYAPHFDGYARLVASDVGGERYTATVDLARGRVNVRSPPTSKTSKTSETGVESAPFVGEGLTASGPRMADVEEQLAPLADALGLDTSGPFEAHRRGSPSLEFRATDAHGRRWNVVYALDSGELSGRLSRGPSGYGIKRILGGLHKTHRYPAYGGARLAWVMFADLTAVVLIFWALSGLLMWTQLRRHRRIGAILIALSLGAAAVVFVGAGRDLTFEGTTRP